MTTEESGPAGRHPGRATEPNTYGSPSNLARLSAQVNKLFVDIHLALAADSRCIGRDHVCDFAHLLFQLELVFESVTAKAARNGGGGDCGGFPGAFWRMADCSTAPVPRGKNVNR